MKQISIIIFSLLSAAFFAVTNITDQSTYETLEGDKVIVDIVGAIENRGLFEIERGDVILDVLNKKVYDVKLTIYADKYAVDDPFEEVTDGMELFIPYIKGYEPSEPIPCVDDLTVDILTKHGVLSSSLSKSVIDFIKLKGMIKTYSELLEVNGMGNVRLSQLSEFSDLC